ncbi:MAG TPA: hypothetical protein VK663_09710 [Burkholderiales bacterium]|nr:hypothetical protein [Burkholderiales bacterium]
MNARHFMDTFSTARAPAQTSMQKTLGMTPTDSLQRLLATIEASVAASGTPLSEGQQYMADGIRAELATR